MKNKLVDLNDHLFCQLERLSDESLSEDSLRKEIDRGKVISDISENVIRNAALILRAKELHLEYGIKDSEIPNLLSLNE